MKTTKETGGWGWKTHGVRTLAICTEACRTAARKIRQFEEQLTARLAAEIERGVPKQLAQQAVNEAEALAWATPYPLLLLPELAEEKIRGARQWASRQQEILAR